MYAKKRRIYVVNVNDLVVMGYYVQPQIHGRDVPMVMQESTANRVFRESGASVFYKVYSW